MSCRNFLKQAFTAAVRQYDGEELTITQGFRTENEELKTGVVILNSGDIQFSLDHLHEEAVDFISILSACLCRRSPVVFVTTTTGDVSSLVDMEQLIKSCVGTYCLDVLTGKVKVALVSYDCQWDYRQLFGLNAETLIRFEAVREAQTAENRPS